MKITIEVSPDAARDFLRNIEKQMSEKLQAREQLNAEIQKLEETVKALRDQLQGGNGEGMRAPRGENLRRITEHLKGLDGKGARMTAIAKATGISVASTSYTLQHNKKHFIQDENSLWRLK